VENPDSEFGIVEYIVKKHCTTSVRGPLDDRTIRSGHFVAVSYTVPGVLRLEQEFTGRCPPT